MEIRSKCKHFRILIIGRSNAGKTTILKKVCNSIDDPMVFSPSGEKVHRILSCVQVKFGQSNYLQIDASVVNPSDEVRVNDFKWDISHSAHGLHIQRGEHNIDNQLIFKSNPEFIFHDSRGFEAGTVDELELVKIFIRDRANSFDLASQLHAIWYRNKTVTSVDMSIYLQLGTVSLPTTTDRF